MNFTTDATIVSYSDNPSTATTIKAAHITELRTAVNAVRGLAGLSSATWTNTTLTAQSSVISADDVRDLRTKLDDALTTLGILTSSYTDSTLATGSSGTAVKKVHITELRTRATSGAGNSTSGGSNAGLTYLLSDVQGSTRAVMNNSGSSSAVVARHDYLPFGEEIGSGLGLRTTGQGYNASDTNRWKYGLTERDNATGLDHTWWRKYESLSGRWTSLDPLNGGIANPQSFNHYIYAENDPVDFGDPSGLDGLPYIGGFGIGPPVYFVNSLPSSGTGHSNSGFGGGGEAMHGPLLDGGDDEQAANIVANGVEAALQVLKNGCWRDQWNQDVKPANRYFANVQNADKYTANWTPTYSPHNKGAKESPAIVDFGVHPQSDLARAMLPPNIELSSFNLVLKYYPGEGMAVTSNTGSVDHAMAAAGYFSGLDANVNVRFAQQLLASAPKCKD